MKKTIIALLVMVFIIAMSACNRQIIDTTYQYDSAIVKLADGTVVSGQVESWKDYADGDQIQIKINGKTYLVHSVNVTLISE